MPHAHTHAKAGYLHSSMRRQVPTAEAYLAMDIRLPCIQRDKVADAQHMVNAMWVFTQLNS